MREIEDLERLSRWALLWVSEIQSDAGKPNQARQTIAEALPVAGETLDAVDRGRILSVLAKIESKAGDIQKARQTLSEALAAANEIERSYWRVRTLLRIASFMPD